MKTIAAIVFSVAVILLIGAIVAAMFHRYDTAEKLAQSAVILVLMLVAVVFYETIKRI